MKRKTVVDRTWMKVTMDRAEQIIAEFGGKPTVPLTQYGFPSGNQMRNAQKKLESLGFQTTTTRGENQLLVLPPAGSTTKQKITLLCQKWEESERGQGVRPDGYSLHPSEEAFSSFYEEYRRNLPPQVPDEYSRLSGESFVCELFADDVRLRGGLGEGKRFWDKAPRPKKQIPILLTREEWQFVSLAKKGSFVSSLRGRLGLPYGKSEEVFRCLTRVLELVPGESIKEKKLPGNPQNIVWNT